MWETQEAATEDVKVWRDSNSDISPPVRARQRPMSGAVNVRQRSLSLPAAERRINYGAIPSLSSVQENRTAWDRLGLYMKGLPSKHLKQEEEKKRKIYILQGNSLDCLIVLQ